MNDYNDFAGKAMWENTIKVNNYRANERMNNLP